VEKKSEAGRFSFSSSGKTKDGKGVILYVLKKKEAMGK